MKRKNILGQSLFEVVLALGLITLIMTAVVGVASLSIVNSSYAKNKTLSTRLSETTLEWVRGERNNGWDDFSLQSLPEGAGQTRCFQTLSWEDSKLGTCDETEYIPDTFIKREIDFSPVDLVTIEVTVRIYWMSGGGYHEVNSSTLLTNWN